MASEAFMASVDQETTVYRRGRTPQMVSLRGRQAPCRKNTLVAGVHHRLWHNLSPYWRATETHRRCCAGQLHPPHMPIPINCVPLRPSALSIIVLSQIAGLMQVSWGSHRGLNFWRRPAARTRPSGRCYMLQCFTGLIYTRVKPCACLCVRACGYFFHEAIYILLFYVTNNKM